MWDSSGRSRSKPGGVLVADIIMTATVWSGVNGGEEDTYLIGRLRLEFLEDLERLLLGREPAHFGAVIFSLGFRRDMPVNREKRCRRRFCCRVVNDNNLDRGAVSGGVNLDTSAPISCPGHIPPCGIKEPTKPDLA